MAMDGCGARRSGNQAAGTASKLPRLRRTRFVCVSDTHNCTIKLPKGDVLIHAGDMTNQGTFSELSKAVQWLEKADFEAKIVIAGNHDITLDAEFYREYGMYFHNQRPESPADCLSLLESSPSITYLCNNSAKIRLGSPSGPHTEFTVYGSPYSPRDGLWAFSYPPLISASLPPPAPGTAPQNPRAGPRPRSRSRNKHHSSRSESAQQCYEPPSVSFTPAPAEQRQTPGCKPGPSHDVAATTVHSGRERRKDRPSEPNSSGPDATALWAEIPLSADVVVTHGPPRGHRDETAARRRAAGCEALRRALWRVRPRLAVCGHVHEGRGAEIVRWDIDGGPGSVNGRFMEATGASQAWEDLAPGERDGGSKMTLVDLTGSVRTGREPLHNDGGIGPSELVGEPDEDGEWTLVNKPAEAGNNTNPSDDAWTCRGVVPGLGTRGMGGNPETSSRCDRVALLGRMGRRETCVVNCAIMANSYPHVGGKKFNKPIVVDLDLPVWED